VDQNLNFSFGKKRMLPLRSRPTERHFDTDTNFMWNGAP